MLLYAYMLAAGSCLNSALSSTREFWRRRFGFDEAVVMDPRALEVIVEERLSKDAMAEGKL